MTEGNFYFIKNSFYDKFKKYNVSVNKENGNFRPCFFSFADEKNPNIFWCVPISSKTNKYQSVYDKNIQKYGRCDFIEMGEFLGKKTAFLVQNMFPVTSKYISSEYYVNNIPVKTSKNLEKSIIKKSKTVLTKSEKGISLTFTNINEIYAELCSELYASNNVSTTPDASTTVPAAQNASNGVHNASEQGTPQDKPMAVPTRQASSQLCQMIANMPPAPKTNVGGIQKTKQKDNVMD